jgi:hypothetical protein
MGALFNAIVCALNFTRLIEYQVVLALALPLLLTPAEGWKRVETIMHYLSQPSSLDGTDRGLSHYYVFNSITLGWGMKVERSVRTLLVLSNWYNRDFANIAPWVTVLRTTVSIIRC